MRLLNLAVASAWALSNLCVSQVIITVTRVVTVDPPQWTSTVTEATTVTKSGSVPPGHTTTIVTTIYVTTTPKAPTQTPTITTVYVTTTPKTTTPTSQAPDPNTTKCPVPLYYQCGGANWKGCKVCEKGAVCVNQNVRQFCLIESTWRHKTFKNQMVAGNGSRETRNRRYSSLEPPSAIFPSRA
ncbi:uncharacterized protein BP5553_09999 [Venustampulla echinocandica]|uniref:CBM1 domain-containing protein n=1 Tax=Venustampulla echinocandica TaxID=2656787 RepID=A0A370TA33_9HELO|nr:uncharacterized protein BP5553_09999 [Venustampulla echinocandica]RDL30654.1 hypothetical protein BP5553_09999 [Venustampulla echinocandica]